MEKGITLEEELQHFDEYSDNESNKENEVEEQQKVRKTLILKQRKQTLISRIDSSYIKVCWVLLFGTLYSIICVAYNA